MIVCDFCDELASFAFEVSGLTAFGPDRLALCRPHLVRYYLGLAYEPDDRCH